MEPEIQKEMERMATLAEMEVSEVEELLNAVLQENPGMPEIVAIGKVKGHPKFKNNIGKIRGTFKGIPFDIGEVRTQQVKRKDDDGKGGDSFFFRALSRSILLKPHGWPSSAL